MRVERRNGYRVVVGGPVPPQAAAITLGRTIVVRAEACDQQDLMAHELVHVRQFRELGAVRFVVRYVGSYLRFRLSGFGHMAAYRRIPLEVEASWVSRLHSVAELEPESVQPATNDVGLGRRRTRRHVHAPRPAQLSRSVNRARRSAQAAAGFLAAGSLEASADTSR